MICIFFVDTSHYVALYVLQHTLGRAIRPKPSREITNMAAKKTKTKTAKKPAAKKAPKVAKKRVAKRAKKAAKRPAKKRKARAKKA